jgi:HD-GYP domain-containing protein (c-di-GMP phosphodiesterase class II)
MIEDWPPWERYAQALADCAREANIRDSTWQDFIDLIDQLHDHNPGHGEHSLRVGLYTFGLAQYEKWPDLKYPLYAGCGHDIGKCDILNEIIDHPNFGPEQMAIMRAHPQYGWERLKDRYLFTAFVAGLHHKFQPDGYGINLEEVAPFPLTKEAGDTITNMAKLVMICDFFDALTTRKGPNQDHVAGTMLKNFPTQVERVLWLLEHQIDAA